MIDRGLKKKAFFDKFIANSVYETEKYKVVPVENRFTTEDWRVLIEIYNILKFFYT